MTSQIITVFHYHRSATLWHLVEISENLQLLVLLA